MSSSGIRSKINLSFSWQGPSKGNLRVGAVDFVFKNVQADISIDIPEYFSPQLPTKLPFTYRPYQQAWDSKVYGFKQSGTSLKMNVETAKTMELTAHFLDPSNRWAVGQSAHPRGFVQEKEIELSLPSEIQAGRRYTVAITSKELELSANLVEDTSPPPLHQNQQKFFNLVKKSLTIPLSSGMVSFVKNSEVRNLKELEYAPFDTTTEAKAIEQTIRKFPRSEIDAFIERSDGEMKKEKFQKAQMKLERKHEREALLLLTKTVPFEKLFRSTLELLFPSVAKVESLQGVIGEIANKEAKRLNEFMNKLKS